MVDFNTFKIFADSEEARKAAELFIEEIKSRTQDTPAFCDKNDANFIFETNETICRDGYKILCSDSSVTVFAKGIRGFIYGFGMFLRRIISVCGVPALTEDISGNYAPD